MREGVLMFLAMLMISVSRGTPSVTFLADTPAKWKVLSVICVVGSPIDCAATVPIISPGYAVACNSVALVAARPGIGLATWSLKCFCRTLTSHNKSKPRSV